MIDTKISMVHVDLLPAHHFFVISQPLGASREHPPTVPAHRLLGGAVQRSFELRKTW